MNTSSLSNQTPIHNPWGMGAVPQNKGTTFRVWAPHAATASVVGDFNKWDGSHHPMQQDDKGQWFIHIDQASAGQAYQYEFSREGRIFRKNDPYAKKIDPERHVSMVYQSNYTWKSGPYSPPAHNELTIYELHVGTFAPKARNRIGTFGDVRRRLQYLKYLGINAIELMPPCEFPSERSWGYNLTNPFAVEENYGGPDALKALIDEAHSIGIAVLLDIVYNHFGPDNLDLWQYDGWSENDKGGIYFYNDWRSWTPWGDNRPDYGRGEVRQFIRDNAMMWFEEYHADGLRLDSTLFMRDVKGQSYGTETEIPEAWSLFQWLSRETQRHFPGKIMIAEDLTGNPWVTRDVGSGGAGFDAQWDASFVHPIRQSLTTAEDADRDMNAVAQGLTTTYNGKAYSRIIYTESHDEVANGKSRVTSEIDPGDSASYHAQKRSTLGAGLVCTAPGIPMLFAGQEFLEDGWFTDEVPLDWTKAESFPGITALYRDLLHLRLNLKSHTAGLTGSGMLPYHINGDSKVIAFQRWLHHGPGDDVVVVANFSHFGFEDYHIGAPCLGEWHVRFNSDWEGYSKAFGVYVAPIISTQAQDEPLDGLPCSMTLALPPYALLILSQNAALPKIPQTLV
jgi:1,4-alpha-glucan branching enzyme